MQGNPTNNKNRPLKSLIFVLYNKVDTFLRCDNNQYYYYTLCHFPDGRCYFQQSIWSVNLGDFLNNLHFVFRVFWASSLGCFAKLKNLLFITRIGSPFAANGRFFHQKLRGGSKTLHWSSLSFPSLWYRGRNLVLQLQ